MIANQGQGCANQGQGCAGLCKSRAGLAAPPSSNPALQPPNPPFLALLSPRKVLGASYHLGYIDKFRVNGLCRVSQSAGRPKCRTHLLPCFLRALGPAFIYPQHRLELLEAQLAVAIGVQQPARARCRVGWVDEGEMAEAGRGIPAACSGVMQGGLG